MKALDIVGHYSIVIMITISGMAKEFDNPYYLDVIGTSYCRSRAIACKLKHEYESFENGELQKLI